MVIVVLGRLTGLASGRVAGNARGGRFLKANASMREAGAEGGTAPQSRMTPLQTRSMFLGPVR